MTHLVTRARDYATAAHAGQTRRGSGAPYITHPERVAALVAAYWPAAPEWVIAAAWLHDTVEDTATTLAGLRREFGSEVADLVQALSKPDLGAGNRATRTALFVKQVAAAGKMAHIVKLADRLANLTDDWSDHGEKFALRYVRETAELLAAIDDHGTGLAARVREAASDLGRWAQARL